MSDTTADEKLTQAFVSLNQARGHNRGTSLPKHTERLVLIALEFCGRALDNLNRSEGDAVMGEGWTPIPCPACGEDSGQHLDDPASAGDVDQVECLRCGAPLERLVHDVYAIVQLSKDDDS